MTVLMMIIISTVINDDNHQYCQFSFLADTT